MTKTLSIHDKEAVTAMLAHVVSECTAINQEAAFDDMLDECYSFEKVGGIFSHMSPSRVLKECDPVAYRCGVNDYFGTSDDNYEVDGELYEKRDVDKAAEEFIDGLRDELTDLESERDDTATELAELEADEVTNHVSEIAEHKATLADLGSRIACKQSAIEACENHAW